VTFDAATERLIRERAADARLEALINRLARVARAETKILVKKANRSIGQLTKVRHEKSNRV